VLFAGRTLSPAAYVPGVLPSGPVGGPVPPPPTGLRDPEGGAWVDEPAPYLVHRALADGRLPLWNDASGLGAPLAANPNMAAWSPLQLAPNLHPTPLVQDLAWLLRVFLLGLSTWALARVLGAGFAASCAAAVALALSGQTLDWIVHHPLNTDVFVPAALACALLLGRDGLRTGAVSSRLALAGLAGAVAAGLLGVKPQSALTGAAFGGLVLAARARDERWRSAPHRARRAALVVAGATLGAALAAVALIPFAESYLSASGLVRAGRSTQSEWTLPLAALPGLAGPWLVPDGVPRPPHAGVVVLALAALGVWRARRTTLGWALAATAALWAARVFGLVPVSLAGIPVLGSVSFVKYCFPLYLALALLVALALAPARRARWLPVAGALAVAAELLILAPRDRPPRLDPYAPAPWVTALRELDAAAPGRITGPVSLAPPLVSGALGFRDLRAIDVLTPRLGYELVSHLVAPSEGVTWILADPDPLVAATAPGADVADLRWILSRAELRADDLPRAVRSTVSGRRLLRLFSTLDRYSVTSEALGGGLHELDGDRRFHWTCLTPCRFELELTDAPREMAAGLAAASPLEVDAELVLEVDGERARRAERMALGDGGPWRDLWIASPVRSANAAARGARVRATLTIDAATPGEVFVGGIGPGPGAVAEASEVLAELAYRRDALARLVPRWRDDVASIVENPGALGEAYVATHVARARGLDEVRACLLAHPRRAVACVEDAGLVRLAARDEAATEVRVVVSRGDALELDVEGARDALVVVSRLADPGWRAWVDGARVQVARVNGGMMGVVVPGGRHRVELRYRPRSLGIGALVSLAALAALVVAMRRMRGRSGGGARAGRV